MASNQLSASSLNNGVALQYDAAGDVTYDGMNSYLYDAEGRICAMKNSWGAMTGYLYDGAGIRVAKGSLASFNCNFSSNGYATTSSYVLGPDGEQVTEYAVAGGTSTWVHTNAFVSGALLATYHDTDTYFALNDWQGTKRAEVSAGGLVSTFGSLPFGNGLTSSGNATDATEQHFTGKERDTESGNDYFEARYYSSAMGRLMSPDWSAKEEPVPYAKLDDPQSLNLYSYVENNPLIHVDADGHCCDLNDVGNFLVGMTNAWKSDNVLGIGREEQTTAAGQIGAAVGDLGATAQGLYQMNVGSTAAAAGLLTEPESNVGGAAVAVAGAAVAVQGAATAVEGVTHVAMGLGSYTNTHASGKTYSGKGDKERSQASGKRVEKATGDKHVATDHTSSSSDRESFKDESKRIDANGGVGSSTNHNQAESPGKKYRQQDGSN